MRHRQSGKAAYRLQAKPAHTVLQPNSQTATRNSGLPFNGLHSRNTCNYIGLLLIYRPRRDGRLSRPGCLPHSKHFMQKVVTCQQQIGRRSGKVRQPKTDVVITEPRRRPLKMRTIYSIKRNVTNQRR